MELPEKYIPTELREQESILDLPRETMYGIGQLNEDGIGMWDGPNPDIKEMLEVAGRDNKSIIVRFNSDGTDEMIYLWNEEEGCWIREREEDDN